MSLNHLLEDFSDVVHGSPVQITDISLEEERLAAFEKGYQSGWDDALLSASDDTRQISANFGQNLQELSFTYQEAYAAVLGSLKSLLVQMADSVLPELAQHTLSAQLAEIMHKMAGGAGPGEFELVTAPSNMATLKSLTDDLTGLTIVTTEDPNLAEGQVFIRLDAQEREFDLDRVLQDIRSAVDRFFNQPIPSPLDQPQKETA